MDTSGLRGRVAAAAAAALLAATTTAWVTGPADPADPGPGPEPVGISTPVTPPVLPAPGTEPHGRPPDASPTSRPSALPRPATARDARPGPAPVRTLAMPTRFDVEALDISMPVSPVGVAADGEMALPPTPAVMGWYEYGPRPGEAVGATVFAAHRDLPDFGTGPAARLDRLSVGELVVVRSGGVVRRYRVSQVSRLSKKSLDLAAIFARTGPARLHVVTCSGPFDQRTRSYEDNLLVVAIQVE